MVCHLDELVHQLGGGYIKYRSAFCFFPELRFRTHLDQSHNLDLPLTLGKLLNMCRPQFNYLIKENDDYDNDRWYLKNDAVMYMFCLK